jgi:tRNA A37 methylthiotransferase MiaB
LIQPDNPALDYYRSVYAKTDGYHMGEHFMEVPTWIAVISGMLPDEHYEKQLHIIENVQQSIDWLNCQDEKAIVLFSVLDSNKHIVKRVLGGMRSSQVKVCGGYVNPKHVINRSIWLDDVKELKEYLPHVDVNAPPDYALFSGMKSNPRLSLSDGCLYNCSFCTIGRKVVERTYENAYAQALSFQGMEFELVYLNDKTFGQAKNWKWIASLYDVIQEYNPEFKGFIVQTVVPMALKHIDEWIKMGVKYVECGVEAVDKQYLKDMRKPYNLKQLDDLTAKLQKNLTTLKQSVGFIPNVIFGLPGVRYKDTLEWLGKNVGVIEFINPYVLCQYDNSHGDMVEGGGAHDKNEQTVVKSWLSEADIEDTKWAMEQALRMTGGDK